MLFNTLSLIAVLKRRTHFLKIFEFVQAIFGQLFGKFNAVANTIASG